MCAAILCRSACPCTCPLLQDTLSHCGQAGGCLPPAEHLAGMQCTSARGLRSTHRRVSRKLFSHALCHIFFQGCFFGLGFFLLLGNSNSKFCPPLQISSTTHGLTCNSCSLWCHKLQMPSCVDAANVSEEGEKQKPNNLMLVATGGGKAPSWPYVETSKVQKHNSTPHCL